MSWLVSARRTMSAAALLSLLLVHGFVGCALNREGGISAECGAASECDDANPCTADDCGTDGFCVYDPIDAPLGQTDGDCAQLVCIAGAATPQPADDPADDDNPCTQDSCIDGETLHDGSSLEGTTCDAPEGQGQCSDGDCVVECSPGDACDDDEVCTTDFCDALTGICAHDALPEGPLDNSQQTPGDCRVVVCQAGVSTEAFDSQDIEDDLLPCTNDFCDQGFAMHDPLPAGSGCTDAGDPLALLCNDIGDCVQCNGPNDCSHLPTDDECQTRTCSPAGVCGQNCTTAGTPLNQQQLGDCATEACDGACATMTVTEPMDVPVDNIDCTEDLCVNGMPLNPPSATGTMCGNGGVCNATGSCVGCNVASDCGADSFCLTWSCDGSQVCQPSFTANDTPLPANQQTAQDCLELRCDGAGAVKTSQVLDPILDGNPCTLDICVNGSPVNPPEPTTTNCMGSMWCDGNGACVQCNLDSQCTSGDDECEADLCINNACMIVFDLATDPAPTGLQTIGDCKTLFCDGNGLVNPVPAIENGDLPNDGNECTQDLCTGGTPSNPPVAAETPCSTGVCNGDGTAPACVECATNTQCTAPGEICDTSTWTCQKTNGTGCGGPTECLSGLCVDGLCCDSACLGTCQACDVAGSEGLCAFVPFNADIDNECAGGACNGMGACKLSDGQGCSLASECLSDECVDSVCCDGPCSGTCQACNISGSVGACTFVPVNVDLDNECAGGACDGLGACKLDLGETCSLGTECLSGFCADSVCCDAACGGTCEACSAAGACTLHPEGTDPETECAADVCSGATTACRCADNLQNGAESDVDCGGGTCALCTAGDSCNGPADCVSGVCSGGTCQAASCGDGVVNGMEVCDFNDPATPCCANTCMGTAALGTSCGGDPDGTGCAAEPTCDGAGTTAANCQAQLRPAGFSCTSNGQFCDGVEVCDAGGACAPTGVDPCPGPDMDGNCSESCDEGSDTCTAPDLAGSSCDDGLFCTGVDTCGATGACDQHGGDPCTGPDGDGDCSESCDDAVDMCNGADPVASACNDGLFCNGLDTCGATGMCDQHVGDPCPGADSDGNCNESCDETVDMCTLYDGEGASCDDGLFCTQTDSCTAGVCLGAGDPCPGPDMDGDCAESCNEVGGTCDAPDTIASACDDGLFCNGADACDGLGVCVPSGVDPCVGPDGDADCNESCDDAVDLCTAYDGDGAACVGGAFMSCLAGTCSGP